MNIAKNTKGIISKIIHLNIYNGTNYALLLHIITYKI